MLKKLFSLLQSPRWLGAPRGAGSVHRTRGVRTYATGTSPSSRTMFRGISQPSAAATSGRRPSKAANRLFALDGFYVGTGTRTCRAPSIRTARRFEMDFYGRLEGHVGSTSASTSAPSITLPNNRQVWHDSGAASNYSTTINNWEVYVGAAGSSVGEVLLSFTDYSAQRSVGRELLQPGRHATCRRRAASRQHKVRSTSRPHLKYEICPKLNLIASAGLYVVWGTTGAQLALLRLQDRRHLRLEGWVFGLAASARDGDKQWWYAVNGEGKARLGKFNAVLVVSKTF